MLYRVSMTFHMFEQVILLLKVYKFLLSLSPVFGRGGGVDGKNFDARQKIGVSDVRQRFGGATSKFLALSLKGSKPGEHCSLILLSPQVFKLKMPEKNWFRETLGSKSVAEGEEQERYKTLDRRSTRGNKGRGSSPFLHRPR